MLYHPGLRVLSAFILIHLHVLSIVFISIFKFFVLILYLRFKF